MSKNCAPDDAHSLTYSLTGYSIWRKSDAGAAGQCCANFYYHNKGLYKGATRRVNDLWAAVRVIHARRGRAGLRMIGKFAAGGG